MGMILFMPTRSPAPDGHTTYASLREFLGADNYPAGVLTVMHGGVPIDIKHDPRGFESTTVFFHAAITNPDARLPVFSGQSISANMPTNRIFVADPSLYLSDTLRLAWFTGNVYQPRLQGILVEILRALIPDAHTKVFFGSSGGGFASLYYSMQFRGSTAVAVNPQTNLAKYSPILVNAYAHEAWNLEGKDAREAIPAVTDLVAEYRAVRPNRVWYVQNRNDTGHMIRHFEPFMDALPEGHTIKPLLVEGEDGHMPPPKPTLVAVLDSAIRAETNPPAV